jgi:hypothetical protein
VYFTAGVVSGCAQYDGDDEIIEEDERLVISAQK